MLQWKLLTLKVNVQVLPKIKYPSGMLLSLFVLTEHTLTIYVQYIRGSKRKTLYLLEKWLKI